MRNAIIVTVLGVLLSGSPALGQDYDKLLKDAGITLGDAIGKAVKETGGVALAAEIESEGGKTIYSVDVAVGTKTAEVNFDAKTGAIIEKASEDEDGSKTVAAAKITLSQAIDAATKKAPGKAVAADLKMKDERVEAKVRIFSEGKAIEVVIDAKSGEVVSSGPAKLEADAPEADQDESFTDTFGEDEKDLVSVGTNPFFVLEPGWVIELKGSDGGKETAITITVLDETKKIAGVETRAVEEKESINGQVKEITRDYFAISRRTNNVYYFGEDVDEYKDGKVVGHGGAWLAGEKGARYGLYMPGTPLVGSRYAQEIAPGVAMDRCQILSVSAKIETPAGKFENVVETKETSAIEKGSETKHHARGIGVVQDGGCKLVKYGKAKK